MTVEGDVHTINSGLQSLYEMKLEPFPVLYLCSERLDYSVKAVQAENVTSALLLC